MQTRRQRIFFVISFDRIISIETTEETFELRTKLTAKEYFENYFGVLKPPKGMNPECIAVRAYDDEMYYLRDVPLHHSQMEIKTHKDFADFEIYAYPTNDLMAYIMQQEDRLEVLRPSWLREKMKTKYENGLRRYQKKTT